MTLDEMFKNIKENGYIDANLIIDREKLEEGETTQHKDGMYIKENGKIIPLEKSKYRGENKKADEEKKSTKKTIKITEKLTFNKPKSLTECHTFKNSLIEAKASCDKKIAWRVDTTHKAGDYKSDLICTSKNGSVAAVTKDGDIISVCKNQNDKTKGKELLAKAVKAGGTKLDSFDGNFGFYTKCGFEPVSWCYFEKEHAPKGWNEYRDKKEPVIFFKYVGIGNVKKYGFSRFLLL